MQWLRVPGAGRFIPGKHHGDSLAHMGSHSGLARVPWMARLWGGIGGLCVAGLGGPTGRQGVTGAEDTDREGRSLGRGGWSLSQFSLPLDFDPQFDKLNKFKSDSPTQIQSFLSTDMSAIIY